MIDLNSSIPVNPLFVWIVPEEYYTIAQTCQMLHITTRRINAYMDREDDPMPFRLFPDSRRLHPQGRPARLAHAQHGACSRREVAEWALVGHLAETERQPSS